MIVATDAEVDLKSQVKFNKLSNVLPAIVKIDPDGAEMAEGIAEKIRTSSVKRYFVVFKVSMEEHPKVVMLHDTGPFMVTATITVPTGCTGVMHVAIVEETCCTATSLPPKEQKYLGAESDLPKLLPEIVIVTPPRNGPDDGRICVIEGLFDTNKCPGLCIKSTPLYDISTETLPVVRR
jgi:hypothetical protein